MAVSRAESNYKQELRRAKSAVAFKKSVEQAEMRRAEEQLRLCIKLGQLCAEMEERGNSIADRNVPDDYNLEQAGPRTRL